MADVLSESQRGVGVYVANRCFRRVRIEMLKVAANNLLECKPRNVAPPLGVHAKLTVVIIYVIARWRLMHDEFLGYNFRVRTYYLGTGSFA